MRFRFHLVPVLIIVCVGALLWSARNAPAATRTIRAPLIEDIRTYRSGEAVRLARKCLIPTRYGWKPIEIPTRYRYYASVVARGNMIRAMFRASRCNDIDYQLNRFFGPHAGQARSVVWCESRRSRYARNGQYLGLFQMGKSERARYGHGSTAYAQVRAAFAYFRATGYDWSPWECKP